MKYKTYHEDFQLCLLPLPAFEELTGDLPFCCVIVYHNALDEEAVLAESEVICVCAVCLEVYLDQLGCAWLHNPKGRRYHKILSVGGLQKSNT